MTEANSRNSRSKAYWIGVPVVAAALIAGFLYWRYRLASEEPSLGADGKSKRQIAAMSKEEVLDVLDDIIKNQDTMRTVLREAIDLIVKGELVGIKKVYEYIRERMPEDPMEKHNLEMKLFDQMLADWAEDPLVHERTMAILRGPDPNVAELQEVTRDITPDGVIAIQRAMLTSLQNAGTEILALRKAIEAGTSSAPEFSPQTANLALQAYLGAFVREEYSIELEAIEMLAVRHQAVLTADQEFLRINQAIQTILDRFT